MCSTAGVLGFMGVETVSSKQPSATYVSSTCRVGPDFHGRISCFVVLGLLSLLEGLVGRITGPKHPNGRWF
jgi:hypothetical protein